MAKTLIMQIPFEGFYESRYSGEIDMIEEQESQNLEESRDNGIEASTYASALFDATNYAKVFKDVAKAYAESFNRIASKSLGIDLNLKFESLDSPREYNFVTDRIFVKVNVATVKALFDLSAKAGHSKLAFRIFEQFTSRDGFASFYSNDINVWLQRDVTEWDHNQIGTLLAALLSDFESDDGCADSIEEAVCHDLCDKMYGIWEKAVNWSKFEAAIAEELAKQPA
jgi:hypothetical protein